jgi:signal transduction histidine kinase
MSFIAAEAIANAVRHAGVEQVTARITLSASAISMAIAGACEVPGLAVPREPPRSIDERVKELGGLATLERSGSDVILQIEVPVAE